VSTHNSSENERRKNTNNANLGGPWSIFDTTVLASALEQARQLQLQVAELADKNRRQRHVVSSSFFPIPIPRRLGQMIGDQVIS